jgi:hypothetical protein
MKIIQIITDEDDIFGLCDGGQMWHLDHSAYRASWTLVDIPCFSRKGLDGRIELIQGNILD